MKKQALSIFKGGVAGLASVIATVLAIWTSFGFGMYDLYVFVSWAMIILSMLAMLRLTVKEGLISTISFAAIYAFFSLFPLSNRGLFLGIDVVSALLFGTILISIELLVIIGIKLIFKTASLVKGS